MGANVVAVIGSKSSGKTTTIEVLIRELTRRGYRVAAIKRIPEKDFTIDLENKDTWRFAQSGAKTVVSVAPNEIATIQKLRTSALPLKEILAKCQGNDIVLVEGFRSLVGCDENIPKIVTVKSADEAMQASEIFKPIIAFTGPCPTIKLDLKVPYIDVFKESTKIADVVEEFLVKKGV